MVVFTRNQTKNLGREELIEKLLQIIWYQQSIKRVKWQIDTFASKHEQLKAKKLQCSSTTTNYAFRTKWCQQWPVLPDVISLEVNPVPREIGDNVLQETVRRAISLTGHQVTPDDLHACHQKNLWILWIKIFWQTFLQREYVLSKSFSGRQF